MDVSSGATSSISLVMTLHVPASAQRVFTALTVPGELAAWFGPSGWSAPAQLMKVEPRLFGRFALHLVDAEHPSMFFAIDALIVAWEPGRVLGLQEDTADGRVLLHIELTDVPDGCRLHFHQGPFTPEIADMNRISWESSFARLNAHLRASYAWWNDLRLAG